MPVSTIVYVIGAGRCISLFALKAILVSVRVGFHGLISARRFLAIYPLVELTILEADSQLGGVWNRERVYEELLTESSLGMYEYSDEPVICDRISGKQISLYLENYAQKHSLYQRIRFSTRLKSFLKLEESNQWQLELEGQDNVVICDKLIIATGLTSIPSIPSPPTSETFCIPQYHVRFLSKIQIHSKGQHAIVVGGAKSAYDAAYSMVKQGVEHVTLVIKEKGSGPAWLIPESVLFNINTDKMIGTRLVAAFTPNIWFTTSWLHFLLHRTRVGQWLIKSIWQLAEELIKYQIGYEKDDNLKKLLPQNGSLFWSSTNTCILNHQDFIEMVKKGQIAVKRSTIVELSRRKTVHFSDGTELETDLIIWATGWKSSFAPLPSSKNLELEQQAEAYVLNQCPILRQSPITKASSPLALYRRLVPIDGIHDHSLVYVGMLQSPGTGVLAEVQAVWSAIYLMGELEINENVLWETTVTNEWLRRRYPLVERHTNYTHDFIRYADLLLADIGVDAMRKKRGWLKEIVEPYMARDYREIVAEWLLIQETKRKIFKSE